MFDYKTILFWLIGPILFFSCKEKQSKEYNVFRYNQINNITSLDPAFAKSQNNIWATHHIFDGLVRLDDELNVIPGIAKKWSVSEDGLTYRFILNDRVYFHQDQCITEERVVTSTDVVYSLSRLIDPEVNSPGSWLFTDKIPDASAFTAVNDTIFEMRLNAPFLPMLGILTMQYCSVVPKECVEYYGSEFREHPIGTGPFQFKRWEDNQALFLINNDNYFRKVAHNLDGIKTTFIPDKKIAFLELLNGNLDFVSGLESSFIHDLLTREGDLLESKKEVLNYAKAPYLNSEYLGINMESQPENSPLKIKEVRQALNLALDRKLMLTALRNNVGKPAISGFVPSGLPSYDPLKVVGYRYNPDSARALILKAGYTATNPMPVIELFTNKDYLDLTTFVARQWQEVGVRVNIEVLESSILRDGMRKSSIPFFRASWIADYPDAESFLCMFYSKYPAPPNYTRYSNPAFDEMYERVIQTDDLEERFELYHQMDRLLIEDAPVIFLFYDEAY
ncbi:MAG: ABC transporter substrate-binding protein [Saprospiraceae bacterium]|nr:ABC transporter substrate-binding protein [Saprospiraceae bacterium]